MRTSPVLTVDPSNLLGADIQRVREAVDVVKHENKLDVANLPDAVREQLVVALEAIAHGQSVASVVIGDKPLTTTEAAKLLGMSRSHFSRLCDEGRIPSFTVGNARRVDSEVVLNMLRERSALVDRMRAGADSIDDRRRARAARAAGLID